MKQTEIRLHAFGKACHLVVDNGDGRGEQLLSLCQQEIIRLEQKFSSYLPGSIISRINELAGSGSTVPLDNEALSLFHYVDALWNESKHIFDPTTRILEDCYSSKGKLLATQEQLQGMLSLVGWHQLKFSETGAHLAKQGMRIDLNSCIRPYAIDSLRKILLKNRANHALISMDRDIATVGRQPDGANWLVGLRFPKAARTAITRLKLNDKGYAIRGDYENVLIANSERFGRALSPVDGEAIPGLLSVAVIADNCLTACSAASVARLKIEANGIKWLEQLGLPWMAIDRQLNCHGPLVPPG